MNETRHTSGDPSDDLRDLERELAVLVPRPASRLLRERIEARLAPPVPRNRWHARLALAATLAIAAGLLLLLSRPAPVPPAAFDPSAIGPSTLDPYTIALDIPPIDPALPTVIVYQQAYARSEVMLDFLLDAHAATAHAGYPAPGPHSPQAAPQRLFNHSTTTHAPAEDPL